MEACPASGSLSVALTGGHRTFSACGAKRFRQWRSFWGSIPAGYRRTGQEGSVFHPLINRSRVADPETLGARCRKGSVIVEEGGPGTARTCVRNVRAWTSSTGSDVSAAICVTEFCFGPDELSKLCVKIRERSCCATPPGSPVRKPRRVNSEHRVRTWSTAGVRGRRAGTAEAGCGRRAIRR